jgi:hypothetical protein
LKPTEISEQEIRNASMLALLASQMTGEDPSLYEEVEKLKTVAPFCTLVHMAPNFDMASESTWFQQAGTAFNRHKNWVKSWDSNQIEIKRNPGRPVDVFMQTHFEEFKQKILTMSSWVELCVNQTLQRQTREWETWQRGGSIGSKPVHLSKEKIRQKAQERVRKYIERNSRT